MGRRKKSDEEKLDLKGKEFTTIDGRTLDMEEYFFSDDFAVSDDQENVFVKHVALLRVLKQLFIITRRDAWVEQAPIKDNGWCATIRVEYDVKIPELSEISKDSEDKPVADCTIETIRRSQDMSFSWSSVADARVGNTMRGYENYTTTGAETRASVRCLRNLLGVDFVGQEEIADSIRDIKIDNGPAEANQIMLIEKKFMQQHKIKLEEIIELVDRDDLTSINDLTRSEAAQVIQKLQKKIN